MSRWAFFFVTLLLNIAGAYAAATLYEPHSEFKLILFLAALTCISVSGQLFYLFRERRPLWRRAATFGFAIFSGWAVILVVRICTTILAYANEIVSPFLPIDAVPVILFVLLISACAILATLRILWTLATDLPLPPTLWIASLGTGVLAQLCFQFRRMLLLPDMFHGIVACGFALSVIPLTLCLLAYERKLSRRV